MHTFLAALFCVAHFLMSAIDQQSAHLYKVFSLAGFEPQQLQDSALPAELVSNGMQLKFFSPISLRQTLQQ